MPHRARSLLILTTCIVLTAGCAGPGEPSSGPDVSAVPEVLDFEAPLLSGGTFHGSDVAGEDVAFWFWAPW